MDAGLLDLPGALRVGSGFPFIGRSAELERLRTLVPRAQGEGRRIVLLGGEAGCGKSRLVREFAAEAVREGVLVLYGACDAVVRMPYGPFVEGFDHLVRVTPPTDIRAALGGSGGEMTRLLPDLPLRVGDLPPPLEADPDTERHRLHTAVTDLLAGLTRSRPALVVLEDCHWADRSTLLLLRHLARAPGDAHVLLLATFRDTEAELPESLAETLADLRRAEDVVRLRLADLSGEEVAEFVRRAAGGEHGAEAAELARAIHELTRGNAFLVCELWRSLVEAGVVEVSDGTIRLTSAPAELGSPESVREVVSRRLARLDPVTSDVLELAAAAGAEFDLDVVRRAARLPEATFLAAIDEAVRSGMIEEPPGPGLAYRFAHELVRRGLYDRLTGLRRAELHLQVGEALELAGDARSGRVLADLAHHFAAAAVLGGIERGVDYNLAAARAASAGLAYDEAAERLRTALHLGISDPRVRAEAFLALGDASHRGGRALDAVGAYRSAAELARDHDDAALLARAAIGYEDACWRPGLVDHEAVDLLEEAAAALGDEPSELRVGLLAGLARALDLRGDHLGGAEARTTGVEMARAIDDRRGLATILIRSYWARGATAVEEILDLLSQGRDLGEQLGDGEITVEAMAWRIPAFVMLSDLGAARAEVRRLHDLAEQMGQPFHLHVAEHYASAIALCDGRLADAERHARRSHEWSQALTGRDASGVYGIQMFSIRREQGRLAELAPVIRILAASARNGPWRPGLVAVLAELGMEAKARRELASLAADGLEPFRESLWLASLAYLADAASALRDETTAALVYPELAAFAGDNVMIGHLVSCYGAADRYLGMLAAVLGDDAQAEEHFETALELNRALGAATWTARTTYEYGRFLLRRGHDSRERAQALLGEAAQLAERIGMASVLAATRALGSRPPAVGPPDGLSAREVQILALVAQGLSNRQIGGQLTISEHTAANHIRSILRKTGCANRTEAAAYAHRHDLTTRPGAA